MIAALDSPPFQALLVALVIALAVLAGGHVARAADQAR